MLARGKIISVDLSKLCNLGTYQEIGKGYDETATERNIFLISKILFFQCLTVNKRLSKIYRQDHIHVLNLTEYQTKI